MASAEINIIYIPPHLWIKFSPLQYLLQNFHRFLKLITTPRLHLAIYTFTPLYMKYMNYINNNILLLTGCRLKDTVLTIKRRDNYAYSNRALW